MVVGQVTLFPPSDVDYFHTLVILKPNPMYHYCLAQRLLNSW